MAAHMFDGREEMPEGDVHHAITRYNAARAAVARRMFYRLMVVVVPMVIVAVVTIGMIATRGPGLPVYGLMIFGFALFYWGGTLAVSPSRRFQRDIRSELLPAVFGFVDEFSYRFRTDPDFPKTALIDDFVHGVNSRHFYMLSGDYRGMQFTLTETEFVENSDVSNGTVFRGIVLQFTLADLFPGTLLAAPHNFSTRRTERDFLERGNLAMIRSGNRQVDHRHEFRTNERYAAKTLLEGEFPEALHIVGQTWPRGIVRLLLRGNKGFLLFTGRKNVFELPGINQSIDYDKHLRPMIRELQSLLTAANLIRSTTVFKQEAFS